MDETKTAPPPKCAAGLPVEGQSPRKIRNTVSVDLEVYLPLLEDTNTPDDQKMELLRALYAIMASFVDLGFTLETEPCGQSQKERLQTSNALRDHVNSTHRNFIERFENAAGSDANAAAEGVEA